VAVVCCPAVAHGSAYLPPGDHVFAGLTGGTSIGPYQRMVGKHPAVFETYMTWNTPTGWLANPDRGFRARLALHISTSPGYGEPAVISPMGIALGDSDPFLISLGRDLARSGRVVYVRLMAEMNGYWNAYAPFDANGVSRGIADSSHFYVQAWRRSVLIVRGGPVSVIDRRLRALGLPPVGGVPAGKRLARPRVAFVWDPQTEGSPDVAGNAPGDFWPGAAYVDWVATDFYADYPNFALMDRLYADFRGKPFAISEWGLWDRDDPSFVSAFLAWGRAHARVRMFLYFQGFQPGGPFDLDRYPRSRAVLKAGLRSARYLAYPPEYAHPKRPTRPAPPPLPPAPGAPPSLQLTLPLLPGSAPPQICLPPLICLTL
jgi:hypothetical protein